MAEPLERTRVQDFSLLRIKAVKDVNRITDFVNVLSHRDPSQGADPNFLDICPSGFAYKPSLEEIRRPNYNSYLVGG
jgi:hypothetical protein